MPTTKLTGKDLYTPENAQYLTVYGNLKRINNAISNGNELRALILNGNKGIIQVYPCLAFIHDKGQLSQEIEDIKIVNKKKTKLTPTQLRALSLPTCPFAKMLNYNHDHFDECCKENTYAKFMGRNSGFTLTLSLEGADGTVRNLTNGELCGDKISGSNNDDIADTMHDLFGV